MKCPMCNGSGKCYEQKIRYQEIETNRTDFTIAKCHKCNGTGEVEMTNEEWFCTLPTEEKATFLAIQVRLGVEFYRTDDERYQNHDWWVKWLKQPYTIKE